MYAWRWRPAAWARWERCGLPEASKRAETVVTESRSPDETTARSRKDGEEVMG